MIRTPESSQHLFVFGFVLFDFSLALCFLHSFLAIEVFNSLFVIFILSYGSLPMDSACTEHEFFICIIWTVGSTVQGRLYTSSHRVGAV